MHVALVMRGAERREVRGLVAAAGRAEHHVLVSGLLGLQKFPNLARFLEKMQARPAYQRALERGGPYAFG